MCDSVQKDTHGLRKIMEDTNFLRMKLEAELEGLKEELAHLRKSHEEVTAGQGWLGLPEARERGWLGRALTGLTVLGGVAEG